uniref:Uncharacterized protein n=1 Tax=Roseihalotalea indica TaxID=2867963 RepID=A0AA49GQA7_9BACT|nr:hypothetical protein K4G66_07280 [Tunicatimonas sp. TK19036]
MKIRLEGFKRLLVESALIVFSVLFALFINRYAENQKTQQQKQVAIERIVQEMKVNREIIDSAMQIHRGALTRLQEAAANETDSFRVYLGQRRYFDGKAFGLLLDEQSFYPKFPSNTSWQAAMATGIVSEFDYEVVENLAEVYNIQRFFIEETLESITEIIYAPVDDDVKRTINTLLLQVNELAEQERTTIAAIDEAMEAIYPPDTVVVEQ